ncbi:YhcB family protein [Endozoicomonas sp. ONNA1]|uniref:YhcB family protein n=1 Tax=unclassified Endozoicomonas TaxID=2644528 RepID=UPI0021498380
MENVNVLWFVGSLAFLAGIVGGVLLYHLLAGPRSDRGKMEAQLVELEAEFKQYQDSVADHFNTTAHLINKLTDSYKDVHEHMANGAESLCDDDNVKNKLSDSLISSTALLSGQIPKRRSERPKPLEQPLDYAPKTTASDEKGTLSEDFRITSEAQEAVSSQKAS